MNDMKEAVARRDAHERDARYPISLSMLSLSSESVSRDVRERPTPVSSENERGSGAISDRMPMLQI